MCGIRHIALRSSSSYSENFGNNLRLNRSRLSSIGSVFVTLTFAWTENKMDRRSYTTSTSKISRLSRKERSYLSRTNEIVRCHPESYFYFLFVKANIRNFPNVALSRKKNGPRGTFDPRSLSTKYVSLRQLLAARKKRKACLSRLTTFGTNFGRAKKT